MPAKLSRTEDALEVSLSDCRGSEFQDLKTKIKEVPGRKWESKRKVWLLPNDPKTAERVLNSVRPEADPKIAEWVKETRAEGEQDLVTHLPDDSDDLLIPWAYERCDWQPKEINGEPFKGLKAHQRALVANIPEKCIVADDQGLGKCAMALSFWAKQYIGTGLEPAAPSLIVCPASVGAPGGVWQREIKNWLGMESISLVGLTKAKRQKEFKRGIEENLFIIANYEQLRVEKKTQRTRSGGKKTIKVMKEPLFEETKWVSIFFDEAHRIKNRKAAQTQGAFRLKAPIMLELTGTPIQNEPAELWSLLHALWPDEYSSYWRFFDNYVDYVEGYFGKDIIGVKNPDALRFELHNRLYRRTKDQVLDLPEKQRITIPVALDTKARKAYSQAETSFWLELEKAIEEGDKEAEKIVAAAQQKVIYSLPNAAARTVRLRQLLSTQALLGGEDHSNKMDALVESVLDNRQRQHVVFSEFRESCSILQRRFEREKVLCRTYTGDTKQAERAKLEDEFQKGDIDVIVGTIGAMKEGLTLTAADTAHFLERSWVPAWNHQAEDRIHRIGQRNPVTIYIYEAIDTVDDGTVFLTNKLKDRIVKTVLPQDEVKEN